MAGGATKLIVGDKIEPVCLRVVAICSKIYSVGFLRPFSFVRHVQCFGL